MYARHDTQRPFTRGVHQRVSAPAVFPVDARPHDHVLPGAAAVLGTQLQGYLERDRHRVLGIRHDLRHLQGMKLQHVRCT